MPSATHYMFVIPSLQYAVRSTTDKGRGVFATKDIPAGTVIGDYLGKLMLPSDEDEEKDGLYTFSIYEDLDVLADPKTEGVHLINHSCMPNCDIFSLDDHVLYVSTRKIFAGEEFSVDYCMNPPESEKTPCRHTCKCGTLFCRGTMHVSMETHARWEKMPAPEQKSKTVTVIGPVGSLLQPLDAYPRVVKDYVVWDIYANTSKKPIVVPGRKLPSLKKIRSLLRETGCPLFFQSVGFTATGVFHGTVFGSAT